MDQPPRELRPALFLDRDGVLNADAGYTHKVTGLQVLPGVPAALTRLHQAGYLLVVVTNQSGVARGYFDEAAVNTFNHALAAAIRANGGPDFSAVYICPHHPDGVVPAYTKVCDCRKPAPGLLLRAAAELGIDLARSAFVGDKDDDMRCAAAAGVLGVQILPVSQSAFVTAAGQAPSLLAALPLLATALGKSL